jgi:N-acyl-D-aspartate/D-glutamate deacylase
MSTLLIKKGNVYDGTGLEPVTADIYAEDGFIREVGPDIKKQADMEIEAMGLAVTPGFVDIHRHCDKSPFDKATGNSNYGEVLLRQGITTVVTGNCGISMYPVNPDPVVQKETRDYYGPVLGEYERYSDITDYRSYMERMKRCRLPVNTAAMIGMGSVRIAVRGFLKGPLLPNERLQCKEIIEEALKMGAPGVSVGLMYLPEIYETPEELGEILKPLGKYDRILTAHIRGEGDSLVKSVKEAIEIAERAGCRLEISHFKSCGLINWGKEIFRAMGVIEKAQREGIKVSCDFYPYDCGSTTLMSLIPPQFISGNLFGALEKMKTEEGKRLLRRMLQNTYEDWDNYVISLGWDKAVISSVSKKENQWKIGKNLCEIAARSGFADEVEAMADLLTTENGAVAMTIHSMEQSDIDAIAKLPYSCVISDAIYAETDRPHPRMYGAFPHFLQEYAVKRDVMTIQEAVAKMTAIPAMRMKLRRGMIKEGYPCDLNIFSPNEFQSKATYTASAQYAMGLRYCIINGTIAVKNDVILNQTSGSLLFSSFP